MKINKIFLVSIFILAIMTLGAVSAADDADNLTVSDEVGDIIEAPADEMDVTAVEENGGSDVIGEGNEVPMNLSIPDHIVYGSYFSPMVSVPKNATGHVSLYIDGEEQDHTDDWWVEEWEGNYYFDCELYEFGEHLFEAKYTASEDDVYSDTIKEQTYFLNNTQYKMFICDNAIYGKNIISLIAPFDLKSDIVITFKGKKYEMIKDENNGIWICEVPDLEFGSNEVGVYYPGDKKFAEYSGNQTVEFVGKVMANYTSDVSMDVLLILPDDATGKLAAYSVSERYDDIDGWSVSYVEIGSADIKDGKAVIPVTDLHTGRNYISANFTGNYEVEDLFETISIEPKVTIPKTIIAGYDEYVVVEVTGDVNGHVSAYYDTEYWEGSFGFADIVEGRAEFSLSDFSRGVYDIGITYYDNDYEWYGHYPLYVVDNFDFNVKITEYPEEVIIKDDYPYSVYYDLPAYADGDLILKIDGKVVDTTEIDIDDNSCSFVGENLSVGQHTLTLDFVSETQKNSSDSVNFSVVVARIMIPDEITENYEDEYGNSIRINVEYSYESSGNYVISIDGEEFKTINFAKGNYDSRYITLPDVARGIHNVTITVNDDKYGSISKSNIVDFDYIFTLSTYSIYGKNTSIFITPPQYLGNGDLIITLDGKVQNWTYDQKINEIMLASSDLAVGPHHVVVQYSGDELYPAKDQKFLFDTITSFDFLDGDVVKGTDVGVTLVLPDDAKGGMKVAVYNVYGDVAYNEYPPVDEQIIPLVNGKAYYSFKDLDVDRYTVFVFYTGDDYNVFDDILCFDVVEDEGMDWGEDSLVLGDNKTITFTSLDNNGGVLHLTLYRNPDKFNELEDNYILLEELEIPLVNGAANYTFDNLTLGYYHVRAIHEPDKGFGYQGGQDFNVEPTKTEAKYGQIYGDGNGRVFIELPNDATGKAILTIQPNEDVVDLDNLENIVKEYDVKGSIIIDLPTDMPAGKYAYLVNYTGNYGNYLEGYWVIVYGDDDRFDPGMEVNVDEITVGEDAVIDISLSALTVGNVTVAIADEKYDLELNKGKATLTLSDLKSGNYDVNVTFNGDEKFIKQAKTVQLVVSKEQTVMDVEITGKDILTVNVNVAGATGKVKVNGKEADLVNGKASVELSDLADGYNTIAVDYDGDVTHDKANATVGVFVMVKEQNNASITVDGVDYPVELDDGKAVINTNKSDDGNITVVVDGVGYPAELVNGTAIINTNKSDDGNITVVVDGVGYPAELVNGTAVVNTEKTEPVVKKACEFSEITIGSDQSISLVLKDEGGNVIVGAPIIYSVNGTAKTVNTDKNGNFVIEAVNGATIVIAYAGNDNITGTNTTIKLSSPDIPTVVKIATQFDIADRAITIKGYAVDGPANEQGIYYATTLLDEKGNPISNAYIEFAVNNKIYNRTTDENGTFNPYKLNMIRAGRYTMAFNFAGDDNYTNAFACVCVDLDKKPIKIKAAAKSYKAATKTKKYTATLSTIKAKDGKMYLSTKKVTLKVNGKTYTAKTNSKGQVTFKITNLTKKAKYTAVISYEGDKTYEGATQKVKLTIK